MTVLVIHRSISLPRLLPRTDGSRKRATGDDSPGRIVGLLEGLIEHEQAQW